MRQLIQYITESIKVDNNYKQKQLDLILKVNPMKDDYHTGIRKLDDIKSWQECLDYYKTDEEGFAYPDNNIERFKGKNKFYVYSSYPIKKGTFVSTSKMMAREYAGNDKVYSKNIFPYEVAWITGDEGLYTGKL